MTELHPKPWHILHFWISGFHRRDCGNIGIRKLKKEKRRWIGKATVKEGGILLSHRRRLPWRYAPEESRKKSVDELAKRLWKKAGFYLAIEGDYLDEGVSYAPEESRKKSVDELAKRLWKKAVFYLPGHWIDEGDSYAPDVDVSDLHFGLDDEDRHQWKWGKLTCWLPK